MKYTFCILFMLKFNKEYLHIIQHQIKFKSLMKVIKKNFFFDKSITFFNFVFMLLIIILKTSHKNKINDNDNNKK